MVKAGSAGSSPDSVSEGDSTTSSHPLRIFLCDVGSTVFVLNTVVVGLDAVERGHVKPSGLDISWDPQDRKLASRKGRKFVLEAVLVRFSEAISEYVAAVSKLPRLAEMQNRSSKDAKAAEKAHDLAQEIIGEDFLSSGVELLIHWRNRVVHRQSHAKLTCSSKRLLQNNEDVICKQYKGLVVDRLLCHFEEQHPTLKDVSSLIAMGIAWARKIDRNLYGKIKKEDLDAWMDYYDLVDGINKVKSETSPKKIPQSIKNYFKTNAPALLDVYEKYYPLEDPDLSPV